MKNALCITREFNGLVSHMLVKISDEDRDEIRRLKLAEHLTLVEAYDKMRLEKKKREDPWEELFTKD